MWLVVSNWLATENWLYKHTDHINHTESIIGMSYLPSFSPRHQKIVSLLMGLFALPPASAKEKSVGTGSISFSFSRLYRSTPLLLLSRPSKVILAIGQLGLIHSSHLSCSYHHFFYQFLKDIQILWAHGSFYLYRECASGSHTSSLPLLILYGKIGIVLICNNLQFVLIFESDAFPPFSFNQDSDYNFLLA